MIGLLEYFTEFAEKISIFLQYLNPNKAELFEGIFSLGEGVTLTLA